MKSQGEINCELFDEVKRQRKEVEKLESERDSLLKELAKANKQALDYEARWQMVQDSLYSAEAELSLYKRVAEAAKELVIAHDSGGTTNRAYPDLKEALEAVRDK